MVVLVLATALLTSCSDNDQQQENATDQFPLQIRLTDAPIDDSNVEACYLSFTGVSVDGKSYMFESVKTVELSALVNGQTELLFDDYIHTDQFSEISLHLSLDKNAANQSPGCYIQRTDNVRDDLSVNGRLENEITVRLDENLNVVDKVILDIDLRKAISYSPVTSQNTNDMFAFTTPLGASVRTVGENHVKIEGTIHDDEAMGDDVIIVYAYQKGTFDLEKETTPDNMNGLLFANAINGARVNSEGRFEMHFMNKGDYELKIISYKRDDSGRLTANAMLEGGTGTSLGLLDFTLNVDITLNMSIGKKIQI